MLMKMPRKERMKLAGVYGVGCVSLELKGTWTEPHSSLLLAASVTHMTPKDKAKAPTAPPNLSTLIVRGRKGKWPT